MTHPNTTIRRWEGRRRVTERRGKMYYACISLNVRSFTSFKILKISIIEDLSDNEVEEMTD